MSDELTPDLKAVCPTCSYCYDAREKHVCPQPISNLVAEIKEYIKNKEEYASSHNTMHSKSFGYLKRCLTELEQVEPVIRAKVIGECVEVVRNAEPCSRGYYGSASNRETIIKALNKLRK